ncbi:hypothetical protein Hypma_003803 [Hypsizygus marmoreus]|uniref:Uncharacterized protein n=1 Tax=Hypsizygus marmoreus TaxID=39966 RepID=A0A369K281_HYPMA|nr:hypothetical protein Hypma_003803 [Hypsizygus marmoreus]
MAFVPRFGVQNQIALREGLKIIRNVMDANPSETGWTTAELFKLAIKQPPPPDYKPEIRTRKPIYDKKGNQIKIEVDPPHPEHPVKSVKFLKRSILPVLEGCKEIKMMRAQRIPFNPAGVARDSESKGKGKGKKETSHASSAAPPAPVTVWTWQPIDPNTLPAPPKFKPTRKLFGTEVGVGEDWSHLNKRRERARVGKVRRDVSVMKEVIAAREDRDKEEWVKVGESFAAEMLAKREAAKAALIPKPLPTL